MRRNRLTARLVAALVAATPAVAVAVTGGAVAVRHTGTAPAATRPAPVLQTFALTTGQAGVVPAVHVAGRVAAPRTVQVPQRATEPFSLVGVTWTDPRALPAGIIEVRARKAGTQTWTPWQPLETDNPDASAGADGPGARGASDPLWVGPSDGIAARVTTAAGGGPLPDGLRVDLINPDAPPEPGLRLVAARRDAEPAAGKGKGPALPPRPIPRLVSRAGWKANEALVKKPPEYTGPVQVVFVHHTASGNGYHCGQSASIVRGIVNFHIRSKKWNDVGYNFLVDKCGTIFEGRAGGVNRSVLGAHTLGFNENASAIAVIGDHRSAPVPAAAKASVAQLAAYKLGAWGNAPLGKARMVSGGSDRFGKGSPAVLNRISAHRDTGRTECPGNSLYGQLGWIRWVAGAAPSNLRVNGFRGAVAAGGRYFTRAWAGTMWSLGTPARMMDRFEVYVDGRLTTAAVAGNRLSWLKLEPGTHTVSVRAVHLSGRYTTVAAQVVADPVPPVFNGPPRVSLLPGTVGAAVPVRVGWTVADTASGVSAVRVAGADTAGLSGTSRALDAAVRIGAAATWTVSATDRVGNSGNAAVTRTPAVLTEAQATRTGTWRTLDDPGHLGGAAVAGSAAGSSLTWRFTGSSAALVAGRTMNSGRVRVYVDGEFQGVVDLRSPAAKHRQAVWTRTWSATGEHTVRVQPEGTAGRQSVVLDGLIHLR
ncbi:N-acetylmuramoyl-L-alanine amidase [Actinoplanes utahensis]|uniref:N-acetylmuramoyl-L-alanine amidase n=1 Tax=Actinoplanes utahensis TaxID=1869 RepID=A0A0A6UTN5_ACTUT|nr:N-acetylmuramoyl-L-alanine amidase [Actinoplanes utahensis]KHD78328.1 N-acetylmuramoyl-L-alanine amidase [Actinoplanes utahensis]GIF28937.1 hypothetical protein Aut01nite_19230 [Actinoplanes utahensis]